MNSTANRNILSALEESRRLIILADEGEAASKDDGCAVLYGIVRDCAYKIRNRAERERDVHKLIGIWDCPDEEPAEKKAESKKYGKKK